MTKQVLRYYAYDDDTRVIYHSVEEIEDHKLIPLGTSYNPDIKMACECFVRKENIKLSWAIKSLD